MDEKRFRALLEEFATKSVGVVGDFILDEYTIGDTKRVSREAPVIVVDYRESRFHPGGAANAVQNVSSLGGNPVACGLIGDDREGSILGEILRERGADTGALLTTSDTSTAVKTRILAGELHAQKQQIARVDRSHAISDGVAALHQLAERCENMVATADAVLMSDYGLGVTSDPLRRRVIEACQSKGIPVVVDSRSKLMEFEGATTAVPNEVELVDAVQRGTEATQVASAVVAQLALDGLIVTCGSKGMMVVPAQGSSTEIGIVGSRDVTDVTGAGDTVAAAVSLALACGASLVEAAEMATYAAAVVVMKRGTATVDRGEMAAIRAKYPEPESA
jgi:rfaE bifunctional protein kinase chain/domain